MTDPQPRSLFASKRFFIVLFLFSNVVNNFVDRVNLSIAAPEVSKYFHWDSARMGWSFSAYLWTYTILLAPCGWIVDRYGTRAISAISLLPVCGAATAYFLIREPIHGIMTR